MFFRNKPTNTSVQLKIWSATDLATNLCKKNGDEAASPDQAVQHAVRYIAQTILDGEFRGEKESQKTANRLVLSDEEKKTKSYTDYTKLGNTIDPVQYNGDTISVLSKLV